MRRYHIKHILICFLVIGFFASPVIGQSYNTKLEYYNNVLAPARGLKPLPSGQLEMYKPGTFLDRKLSVLDVGNVIVRISNGATLGYDRWGKCWEYPANSGLTYRWSMAPIMGGIIPSGKPIVSSSIRGSGRPSEEEFEPLSGYDAGVFDQAANIGVALSDIPQSWPASWPTGPLEAPIGKQGFPGVQWNDTPSSKIGDVVATREMYFVVTDDDPDDSQPEPLHVRINMWGLQWDDMLNQDFIIFRMIVSNIGTEPIKDFYIGIHDDPDTPEQGSQEWTDDFAEFYAVGSDVPGYSDKEDSLLWNLGVVWDGDDQVQGFIPSKVPWVGLKVLETPDDPNNPGTELGLTTLDVFEYSQVPQTEIAEYEQLQGVYHVMNPSDTNPLQGPNNIEPHPEDWTQTPNTFGPDITYVFASGPFQFNPNETLTFSIASIHSPNKKALVGTAIYLQTLWEGNLVSAEAPPEPVVRAIAGDKKVSLYWGNNSETGIYADGHVNDQLTGTNMFEGYKIYKSLDRGFTWGTQITDMYGTFKGYIPLAQYDLNNLIIGESEDRPFFNLGTDSGLKHYYIDQIVSNGFEYWYAVTAYDRAEGIIFPLENSIKTNAHWSDDDNTVGITPFRPPTGSAASSITNAIQTAGTSDLAEFETSVIDPTAITGHTYTVEIDSAGGSTSFTVKDGGTIVKDASGNDILRRELFDSGTDNAPIFDGIRMEVTDISPGINSNTGTNPLYDTEAGYYVDNTFTSRPLFNDYEWEFTADNDLYPAVSYWFIAGYNEPDVMIPIKITDITVGKILVPIWRDGNGPGAQWDYDFNKWESLYLQEGMYYDPDNVLTAADFSSTAGMKFQVLVDGSEPLVGDKVTIITKKPLTVADVYTITTTASSATGINETSLEDIQAVPNPFIVSSRFETSAYGIQKLLQFHQLPEKCSLRIYNMAGDFIREKEHNGGSIESWNLQNYNGQEVSFGVYFLHVDAPGIGKHIAKFAIIK